MSANEWVKCPKCGQTKEEVLESIYGKVDAEEYERKRAELEACALEEKMRLDYEIRVEDGKLEVAAMARCTECKAEAIIRTAAPIE